MSRPLKFRAWNGTQMFYPSSIHWKDQSVWCCEAVGGKNVYEELREDACLMQFTGLVDRNGKEIYEGDIVRVTEWNGDSPEVPKLRNNGIHVVEIDAEGLGVSFVEVESGSHDGNAYSYRDYLIEILGNRYEHPHLLPCPRP